MNTSNKILLAIIIASVLGTAGLYLWQSNRINKLQQQIEQEQSAAEDLIDNQTAGQPADSAAVQINEKQILITEEETAPLVNQASADASADINNNQASQDAAMLPELKKIASRQLILGQNLDAAAAPDLLNQAARQALAERRETIVGAIMPENPANSSQFFFSTKAVENDKPISRIYSYNTATGKLQEIYWQRNYQTIWLWGIDSSKLILQSRALGNAPDFSGCYTPWLDDNYAPEFLDITIPAQGTAPYELPPQLAEQALSMQLECQAELNER